MLERENAASHLLQVLGAEGEGQELVQCLDDVGAVGFGQVDVPVLAELQEESGERCPMPKLRPPGGCARVAPIICLGAAPGGYLGLRACISPLPPQAWCPKNPFNTNYPWGWEDGGSAFVGKAPFWGSVGPGQLCPCLQPRVELRGDLWGRWHAHLSHHLPAGAAGHDEVGPHVAAGKRTGTGLRDGVSGVGGFVGLPLAPHHGISRPHLAMAMALKRVCPSEMAFWMAVRSAHTPRL